MVDRGIELRWIKLIDDCVLRMIFFVYTAP